MMVLSMSIMITLYCVIENQLAVVKAIISNIQIILRGKIASVQSEAKENVQTYYDHDGLCIISHKCFS